MFFSYVYIFIPVVTFLAHETSVLWRVWNILYWQQSAFLHICFHSWFDISEIILSFTWCFFCVAVWLMGVYFDAIKWKVTHYLLTTVFKEEQVKF